MSNKTYGTGGFGGLVLVSALAYLVYGSFKAVCALLAYTIIGQISVVLGLIPIAGNILQWHFLKWLQASFLSMASITPTWLTSMIFWLCLVLGFIVSFVVIIVLIIWKSKNSNYNKLMKIYDKLVKKKKFDNKTFTELKEK